MPRIKIKKATSKRKVGSIYKGDSHYVPPVGPYLHIPNYSYYLRCDIGKGGAVVALNKDGEFLDFLPYPLLRSREYDVHTLGERLTSFITQFTSPLIVTIEHVSARSTDARSMICSFGGAYGMMKGMFGMLKVPFHCVHPLKWMREFSLFGKGKEEGSIKLANEIFTLPPHLKHHDGATDAALLALWGKRHLEKFGGYPQGEVV